MDNNKKIKFVKVTLLGSFYYTFVSFTNCFLTGEGGILFYTNAFLFSHFSYLVSIFGF